MLSNLSRSIAPFHVMEVIKRADELEQAGQEIIHLSIGEPDFPITMPVLQAMSQAAAQGKTRYTAALGLRELREQVSQYYVSRWGVQVPADQIVITSGASAALLYACLALIDHQDEVCITDPGYPCNKSFIQTAGGVPRLIPVHEANNFEPDIKDIEHAFQGGVKGLLLASPSNPTGTRISQARLEQILSLCQTRQRFLIMDEIYQELVYDTPAASLLQIKGAPTDENPFVIVNSFSKYFGMTGLRLGWMVVPPQLLHPIEKLAQNLAICPNTPAQVAAMACFTPEVLKLCEQRRQAFADRRHLLMERLPQVGLTFSSQPDSAFYFYIQAPYDSDRYCLDLLEKTGVCTVPGKDFSTLNGQAMLRISYANSLENIKKALDLIEGFHHSIGLNR